MSMYRLYGTGTVTADAVASLDIRADGVLNAWEIAAHVIGADALNDGAMIEIGFGSTRQILVNDVQNCICLVTAGRQGFLTTGGGPCTVNLSQTHISIPVSAGERLYMHAVVGGTTTFEAWFTMHVDDGMDVTTRPSVRRGR